MNGVVPGTALNLGSGVGVSFRDLATMACGLLGHPAGIACVAGKPQGVHHRVADTYMMRKLWQPKISLDEGIERTARYLRGLTKLRASV